MYVFQGRNRNAEVPSQKEALKQAKEEAYIGEETWKPEGNPKVTASHRQRIADKKADKQTEGWIKVIRGKRK